MMEMRKNRIRHIADTKTVDMVIEMAAEEMDIITSADRVVEDTIIKIAQDSNTVKSAVIAAIANMETVAIVIAIMTIAMIGAEIEDMVAVIIIIQTIVKIDRLTKNLTWTRSTQSPTIGCIIRTTLPSSAK